MASYPTSVKSFSTKSTTDVVEASHPNDLQDEVTAIETDLIAAFPGGGADGGQMKFPATQNASADVNTLDDYEEGTWTPTIGGTTSESGQVYSTQAGRYIKVGKLVTVFGRVTLSTLGTITGDVRIKGLPFTSVNAAPSASASISFFAGLTTSIISIFGFVQPNTTAMDLRYRATAGTSLSIFAQADLSNTTDIVFSVTYEATA